MQRKLLISMCILLLNITPVSKEANQTSLPDFPKMSGALRALQFLSDARSYPAGDIPSAGIADAFQAGQHQRSMAKLSKNGSQSDLKPWRAIGPQNIGGRTLALALNPLNLNTLYAGSASGGLWRSYSGGKGANAWQYLSTGFPVLAVSSIAIVPGDSNTIYIGTGEMYGNPVSHPGVIGERLNRGSYGIGVLKTTDGGRTWQKSLDWLYNERRGIQRVRINPKRPETVWAATTIGTFRSYDAGQTWQQVNDVVMATDLVINSADTSIIIAGHGGMASPGHGIYRSTDGGNSWQKSSIPGVETFNGKIRLAISQSSPEIAFASIGNNNGSQFNPTLGTWLVRTSNAGEDWTVVSTEDYASLQGWYSHDVAVHPGNPDIVWTAGLGGPLYSDNGGPNLTDATSRQLLIPHPESVQLGLLTLHPDYHDIILGPPGSGIVYFASDGGIFLSEDDGATIQNCNRSYQTTQFYNGTSSSETDSLFALGGTQDNSSYVYEGNLFWRRIGGGDGSWTAMNQNNNDFIYYSFQFLSIIASSDRGRLNSQGIPPPSDNRSTNFIAPFILSPADNFTLYAGSTRIFKREGLFQNEWAFTNGTRVLDGNPAIGMAGSYQDAGVVYVLTSPIVDTGETNRAHAFRTGDGGASWQDITGDLPDRFLIDIVVDPNDHDRVFVTVGGFGTSHLFTSSDGGDSWLDIGSGLPDIPTWSVAVDPDFPDQIFAGNDIGVYYSPDGGINWQPHMGDLPDAIIAMDLTISPANRVLRLATHGNGFYESHLPNPPTASVSEQDDVLPGSVVLQQNYPNPFNPETRIQYFLRKAGLVNLVIYNLQGQTVRTLVSGQRAAGWNEAVWDGKNERGQPAASGVYVYRLRAGGQTESRKMTLAR